MNVFQFVIICKRTNNANNATHYVKLGKKRRESSKRNYYINSPRVIIKAIIIITNLNSHMHPSVHTSLDLLQLISFQNPQYYFCSCKPKEIQNRFSNGY